MSINLLHGDCLEQMKTLEDNSVDAIVSDPPYGISFMSKKWDYDVPSVEVWKEAMRVLKPGGHALIACGTRTQHRMVCNIEDAGFEIRDVVSWIYGSGFPKSLNISKAIDKAAGAEREDLGAHPTIGGKGKSFAFCANYNGARVTAPATEAAKQWDGWGTALKPACEFFTLCRKPLSESTVAKNVLKWGTGGINIDGCRVGTDEKITCTQGQSSNQQSGAMYSGKDQRNKKEFQQNPQGRFPANLIHDGSQEVLDLFPETKSAGKARAGGEADQGGSGGLLGVGNHQGNGMRYGDNGGSAARFFYCPKASKKDRNEGCEKLEKGNNHATVKPNALMAYLCRLITPPNGVVLDPYMGSGSTGKAAVREGFSFVGIELDEDYFEIAKARVTAETQGELES
jgi:site-specific DNA-methyltransferase (adenine-specific)